MGDDAGGSGFFVVTESKYGATVFQGCVQVSLLRSAFISHPDLVKPAEMVNDPASYSDMGKHRIRMAIGYVGADSPREEQPPVLADTLFTAPVPYNGGTVGTGFIAIDGLSTLHPCWAKPRAKAPVPVPRSRTRC